MVEELKKLVGIYFKNMKLKAVYDLEDYYVISIWPNTLASEDYPLDSLYRIEKNTLEISGFSPMLDLERFKKSVLSPIYLDD